MYCILSSATHEILSYVAHEKRLPAQVPHSYCRPSKGVNVHFCDHVGSYLAGINSESRAGLRKPDGETLIKTGVLKDMMRRACHAKVRKFSSTKYLLRDRGNGTSPGGVIGISCPKSDDDSMQPYVSYFHRETAEVALRDRLNDIGKDYALRVDNTGGHTILRHLNDLEMAALNGIVERDAPECREQLEAFKNRVRFNYRSINMPPEAKPWHYWKTATPEPVRRNQILRYEAVPSQRLDLRGRIVLDSYLACVGREGRPDSDELA